MTHDFAKIRPEPLLEKKQVEAPPAWSLMFTGIAVGISIGVFGCFLFYMSGRVPPLTTAPTPVSAVSSTIASQPIAQVETAPEEPELELEFYTALQEYEVTVDAEPVEIPEPVTTDTPLEFETMLQTGAFQQRELAYNEMERLRDLGLAAIVQQESSLPGRTLYLVQTGPYQTQGALSSAEQLLKANNIRSMRLQKR